MNDLQIRVSFHSKWLRKYHYDSKTMVVNELGLNHGKCRADIAIINGRLIGYEIKSDSDSLRRLNEQIVSYNAIFDRAYLIVTRRHLKNIEAVLPGWWGIIYANEGKRGAIHFKNLRRSQLNPNVDDYAVARLLWRPEAQKILGSLGVRGKQIRQNRENLYGYIVSMMTSVELRETVRNYLIKRTNWRCPLRLFPSDD
jgi:hypothetical protein